MTPSEKADLAIAAGRSWAETLADMLRDVVPAVEWPDVWNDADDGELPFAPGEIDEEERHALQRFANHAAHERWRELVAEQRRLEALDEEERDEEAQAAQLEEQLREELPEGLVVGRDGPRVYIEDVATGMERTVTSLEHAWRVIDDWRETRLPGV